MDNTSVGINFRKVRERLGLTQLAMAERLGISREYYARIEAGKVSIIHRLVGRLSEVSGESVGDIMNGGFSADGLSPQCLQDPQEPYGAASGERDCAPLLAQLLSLVRELSGAVEAQGRAIQGMEEELRELRGDILRLE